MKRYVFGRDKGRPDSTLLLKPFDLLKESHGILKDVLGNFRFSYTKTR